MKKIPWSSWKAEVMYGEKSEVPERGVLYWIRKGRYKEELAVMWRSFLLIRWWKLHWAQPLNWKKKTSALKWLICRTVRPLDLKTILESVKKPTDLWLWKSNGPSPPVSSGNRLPGAEGGFWLPRCTNPSNHCCRCALHYAPNLVAAALPDVARTVKLVKEVMYQKK